MTSIKTLGVRILTVAITVVMTVAAAACTATARQEPRREIVARDRVTAAGQEIQTIDHVTPVRDSIGPAPTLFEWTAAKDADEYSMGIWNEVDRMVWRKDHVAGTSTTRPADVELEPGTYFWTVAALQRGRQIADSGLAAFVVKTE